jgi:AraC-like DNA-binding protein
MSRIRQTGPAPIPDEERLVVRTLALRFSAGTRTGKHAHPWCQLIHATHGVMTVDTEHGTWVVPSERAVWVPADVEHEIETAGPVTLRTLYLRPELSPALPTTCFVVHVSPLLRELVLHAVRLGHLDRSVPAEKRLAGVLVDQVLAIPALPLSLPLPRDERARKIAALVRANPAGPGVLGALAHGSGASLRTLERLFRRETGLSFGRWRQRARLLHALHRLAAGEPVTSVALDVGYDSPSAFIAMFKRELGTTPGRYYRG